MYPVRRTGERLVLRELTGGDVGAVHRIYGDPVATEHLSFEPRTREQVGLIVDRSVASAGAEPRTEYALAVEHADAGLIGFARLATEGQSAATIGFALRPDHWGRGLGSETVRMLLGLGFDGLGLHRVWAARAPANTASERTLLRAGMVREGRIRDHVHVRGGWRDSVTYSILEHEWRARS